MGFIPQEIIRKKRDGGSLSRTEIEFMVAGFVDDSIPDYQMSSLAMAIFLQGFSSDETACLLHAMIASGVRYEWDAFKPGRIFVDKHSTGGVGDKTSLVILPLLIADGLDVPMISGRGLGHTGGTLDKLESLPGFVTRVDAERFREIVRQHHGAFGAQTDQFVPADKKLYALRDVTATVESEALITASIMSKKLGEGLDGLVLDVKFGSGAFMKDYEKAKSLARSLIGAGKSAGCRCVAALTNMDEPLGRTAGHALEIVECLDVMQGSGPEDTRELSLYLAAGAACAARGEYGEGALQAAYERMQRHLASGKPFEIFKQIAVAHGANAADVERRQTAWIFGDSKSIEVFSGNDGVISAVNTRELGLAILELGGGRRRTADVINPFVGLSKLRKVGEKAGTGEPLCVVHYSPAQDVQAVVERVRAAFTVVPEGSKIIKHPLIKEWIWS